MVCEVKGLLSLDYGKNYIHDNQDVPVSQRGPNMAKVCDEER